MSQAVEPDLDGSTNVLLAPVRGTDERRKLPKTMFVKRPAVFTVKFVFAVAIVAVAWVAVALRPTWWVIALSVIVNGLMYAHLVELQHETLHEHAYNKRGMNRFIGFLAGAPMLSSYWHYKHDHLRHHAYLGTPQNQEFFNYRFDGLGSIPGFVRGAYHLGRYLDVVKDTARSLIGRTNPMITKTVAAKKIRTEYQLFAVLIAAAIAYSVVAQNAYLVWVWVLPTLLVAEPTHFLIEMPEHYGLNTQTDPDVLSNTRTIEAGWFAKWFTNGNDVHTAHHFHQGVPMVHVRELHGVIENRVQTVEPSYWAFYRDVFTGRITYQDSSENCMTR
ncbi:MULTISPECIES: fatty acid desaturase [unclassified Streptomyces]|uniref:fatty acid desaturase family protein n=1 Tax=unclassified Streptomyces TaxID=2593676 RepID=UPI00344B2303